jgi:hypothetical protein
MSHAFFLRLRNTKATAAPKTTITAIIATNPEGIGCCEIPTVEEEVERSVDVV